MSLLFFLIIRSEVVSTAVFLLPPVFFHSTAPAVSFAAGPPLQTQHPL